MQSFLAGQDVTVAVVLTHRGEPFVPDNNTVQWELRGHDGSVLSPKSSLGGVQDTTANITVGAVHNTLAADRTLEKRTLIVSGTRDNQAFTVQQPYRLTDFLNMSATPAQVRTFIGLDEGELPDEDIDLIAAYFDVADLSSLDRLQQALGSDGSAERAANRAIVAQAVLNLLPSLPARLSKKETDGASAVERFQIDFNDLERKAIRARNKGLVPLQTQETPTRTLVAFTQRPDPISGA